MPPGKREVYQHDINVPLIVSGPGIPAGSTIHAMAANYGRTSMHHDATTPAYLPLSRLSVLLLLSRSNPERQSDQHAECLPIAVALGCCRTAVDLAITWATLAGVSPATTAPVIDGKSLVPLLLSGGRSSPVRTYTLQEGYQSCEAGHGEGRACSHKVLLVYLRT